MNAAAHAVISSPEGRIQSPEERYEQFRSLGIEARDRGLLHEAFEHLDHALDVAREIGDDELIDRAVCNRAAISISLGENVSTQLELRQILMGNRSLENSFLAAYNLARCHELAKEPKKSLFYGRIARDRANDLARPEWAYGALNQIANALAAESRFGEAAARYREAIASLPSDDPTSNLEARINLGYCLLMESQLPEGLGMLYRGLRDARVQNLTRLEMIARLDLALGTLEAQRPDLALRHVSRGLALAERSGDRDSIKNGLYLEGEIWSDLAEWDRAREVHARLQRRFYPGQPEVRLYLEAIDTRQLFNLRA